MINVPMGGASIERAALLRKYKKQRRLKRKCSFRLAVLILNGFFTVSGQFGMDFGKLCLSETCTFFKA